VQKGAGAGDSTAKAPASAAGAIAASEPAAHAKRDAEDLIDHFVAAINTMVMSCAHPAAVLTFICAVMRLLHGCHDCWQAAQLVEVPGLGYKKGQDSTVKMTTDEDDGPALLDTCQVMCANVQSCHQLVVCCCTQPCRRSIYRRRQCVTKA
jgi:hypothetical protein